MNRFFKNKYEHNPVLHWRTGEKEMSPYSCCPQAEVLGILRLLCLPCFLPSVATFPPRLSFLAHTSSCPTVPSFFCTLLPVRAFLSPISLLSIVLPIHFRLRNPVITVHDDNFVSVSNSVIVCSEYSWFSPFNLLVCFILLRQCVCVSPSNKQF